MDCSIFGLNITVLLPISESMNGVIVVMMIVVAYQGILMLM